MDVKHHVYFTYNFGVNVQSTSLRAVASSVPSVSVTSLCYSVSVHGSDLAHRATAQRP